MGNKSYPTDAELEILQVLWKEQPATVRQVHERLSQIKQVGYTTTLKQMQRMLDSGLLERSGQGKSHTYTALISEENVQQSLFNKLMQTAFKGSAMEVVMHALGKTQVSPNELEELEAWIQSQKDAEKDDE